MKDITMTEEQQRKRDGALKQIQKLDARLGVGVGAIKERQNAK